MSDLFWAALVGFLVAGGIVREVFIQRRRRYDLFLAWAAGWHGARGGVMQSENPWRIDKKPPHRL